MPNPNTPSAPRTAQRPWVFMFVAVCLVAANMRMTILGIGPLIETIAADEGVNPAALGLLASVPLLTWAIVSPLAHGISERFGTTHTISWSLVVLIVGTLWRSMPDSYLGLWAGTALMGAALAIGNVLMPAIIKREFPNRLATVMGIYTALLGGMGSVGAGIVVPVSELDLGNGELGWRYALLATGLLVPVALIVWIIANHAQQTVAADTHQARVVAVDTASITLPVTENTPASQPPGSFQEPAARSRISRRIWRDRLAWFVALYMGTQSAIFFALVTWIAPYEVSLGRSEITAGFDVMLFQLYGILGSLTTPLLFRGRLKRWSPLGIPLVIGLSGLGMALVPSLMVLWLITAGLGCGASLSISVMFMAVRSRTASAAAALSGMAQSVGYAVASLGPIIFGWLHQTSGLWLVSFVFVFAMTLVQVMFGTVVRKDAYVLDD